MKKPLIFAAAAVIGISGGLYFALNESESPALPDRDFAEVTEMRDMLAKIAISTEDDVSDDHAIEMLKLNFGVRAGSNVSFKNEDGSDMTLAAFEGQYVVLNFWATWCAPCRKEMPHLSQLQDNFGEGLEVVTIATGSNQRPAMERFFEEIGVDNLPMHTDANSALARDMGVVGLPVTLILDPEGYEIARLIGDADWTSESAVAILTELAAKTD